MSFKVLVKNVISIELILSTQYIVYRIQKKIASIITMQRAIIDTLSSLFIVVYILPITPG